MSFVDRVQIGVKAGDGGPGASSFRREKFVPKGGPDGGDGGRGADVVIQATRRLQTLLDLSLKRQYKAPHGDRGGKKNMFGLAGKTLVIMVPVGTMIFKDNELHTDLNTDGAQVVIAKGGKGGKGNQHFATSINRAPRYAQTGLAGEQWSLVLELRMIAEVGLVGLPNAGKSTLLKTLTRANPKIADYPFTTLHPNLGVLKFDDREIVIADIPGIIEGAAEGHGLGLEFLRHVDRTRLVLHIVAMQPEDPAQTWADYTAVREELAKSEYPIQDKKTIVVLNKRDIMAPEDIEACVKMFAQEGCHPLVISGINQMGIPDLISSIVEGLR